jgi:hypothetical protein
MMTSWMSESLKRFFVEDFESAPHQLVVVGLVASRPAEGVDAGLLGKGNPDLRNENSFEVEANDEWLHGAWPTRFWAVGNSGLDKPARQGTTGEFMRFRNAIFAGGGSRCFWQLGFWEGAKESGLDLQSSVEFIGSTSAGCAMATAAIIDRAHDALSIFQAFTKENPKNIHWWNLHPSRRGSLFPHARMYREALYTFITHDDLTTIQGSSIHFLMSGYPKMAARVRGRRRCAFNLCAPKRPFAEIRCTRSGR